MKLKLLYLSMVTLAGILSLNLCTALAQPIAVDDGKKAADSPASSASTNQIDVKNKASNTNDPFKIVTDEISGNYAMVDTNKNIVLLNNAKGTTLWATNIVEGLKQLTSAPQMRGRNIRGIRVHESDLWVDMGRGYAIVDLHTGQLKGTVIR